MLVRRKKISTVFLETHLAEVLWTVEIIHPVISCPCDISEDGKIDWSLVVAKNGRYVNVRFLVKCAPHYLLTPGREFGIFAGGNCLLRGRIVV